MGLLVLTLGLLLCCAVWIEGQQMSRREHDRFFVLWRCLQFSAIAQAEAVRLQQVQAWGANHVMLDAAWYSEYGGARSSAVRSARAGVTRAQPCAPLLLSCCHHLRRRRLL